MKFCYFTVFSVSVLLLVVNYGHSQEVNFSNKKKSATQTTSKKSLKDNNDKNVKSKTFKEDNGLRAASTCYNCECQCDSYGWNDAKGNYIGNCQTADTTGAKFCYISGRALRVCRDIKQSKYRQDSNNGQKKWYSYEACSTPRRNECYRINQQYSQNCGDGDYNNGGGNNNNGYPNNNNGYPNNNNGYPNNNNGYPNNNNGYPNNNNGYPNNNNGYPNNNNNGYPNNNNNGYPNNNNGYPNNNNGYPNNNNGRPNNNNGYPNNNNGYPNNNNGRPNNNNGYPNNNNGRPNNNNGYPSNNNGYPNNNNGRPNNNNGYPSNNGNSWTLQSQIPGLGSPRSDKDKETSITFGQK